MIENLYPTIQEKRRSVAVSYEAQFIRRNIESSHYLFLGQSVLAKEMYNRQLKKKFDLYTSIWKNETMFSSSVSEIINNAAYRSIIEMGEDIIPLIFQDLEIHDNHWFYALEALTGENPILKEHRGKVSQMKADWLNWAKNNNQTNEG